MGCCEGADVGRSVGDGVRIGTPNLFVIVVDLINLTIMQLPATRQKQGEREREVGMGSNQPVGSVVSTGRVGGVV